MLLRAHVRHSVLEEKSMYLIAVGFIAKVYCSAPSFEKNSKSYSSVDFLRDKSNNDLKNLALFIQFEFLKLSDTRCQTHELV